MTSSLQLSSLLLLDIMQFGVKSTSKRRLETPSFFFGRVDQQKIWKILILQQSSRDNKSPPIQKAAKGELPNFQVASTPFQASLASPLGARAKADQCASSLFSLYLPDSNLDKQGAKLDRSFPLPPSQHKPTSTATKLSHHPIQPPLIVITTIMLRNPTSALFCRSLRVPIARVALPRIAMRAASVAAMPSGAIADSTSSSSSSSTTSSFPGRAISNPTLANIEKRWEGMPLQEQADLWMALRDRMQGNWNDLTVQEKKAGACHLHLIVQPCWNGKDSNFRQVLEVDRRSVQYLTDVVSIDGSSKSSENESRILTSSHDSVLDCVWPSRPPSPGTARPTIPGVPNCPWRHRPHCRHFRQHPLGCPPGSSHHVTGMAGSLQRIPQGPFLIFWPKSAVQDGSNSRVQSQNSDPISGISSPGYSGRGMIQSAPTGYRPDE